MIINEIPKCLELKNGGELAIYDYQKCMGVESFPPPQSINGQ